MAGATLLALAALVDKSLVRLVRVGARASALPHAPADSRFTLLEPIREYAQAQLALRGETEALQRAHALLLGAGRSSRGLISEGRAWLAALLARADTTAEAAEMAARLQATQAAAWLASNQHDFAQAEQLFERSISIQRALGETGGETQLLFNAALQARAMGHYQQAISLLEEALTQHRARGDRGSLSAGGLGLALYGLGLLLREQGDFARAATLFEEFAEIR